MFGGFTFASEVLLGRIAGFYGFAIAAAENQTSLANFLCVRLPHARHWAIVSGLGTSIWSFEA